MAKTKTSSKGAASAGGQGPVKDWKKQDSSAINEELIRDLAKLVGLIDTSTLSEGKKLAYLYMIADGSFSIDHLEGLKKDLEEAGRELQKKADKQADIVKDYDSQVDKLEGEISTLMDEAAAEHQQNLDKIVEAAAKEAEKTELAGKDKIIKKIKTKLSK